MSIQTPTVSVLMTAYNREKYIAEAIESVLASTYQNFELIIIDDQSKDKTVEIAKGYEQKHGRVKVYINETNLGDYPNRNMAASYAIGKYIKYLDSDDVMYAHCLQVMVAGMECFPEAGFGLSCVGDSTRPYPCCLTPAEAYKEYFLGLNHFDRAPGSSIIRKTAFDVVGGFSGKRMIGDNEMWFKIARYFPMVKLPVDLYWSRMHDGQESKSKYADEYQRLRRQVFLQALNHADCPLLTEERIKIKKQLLRNKFKSKIIKIFR